MSSYDQQATDFLTKHNLSFQAVLVGLNCPAWAEDDKHGLQYQIVIRRKPLSERDRPGLTFPFWGSIRDKQERKNPNAYNVLTCISSDLYVDGDFDEYCGNYGYDTDSRNAKDTWKRCVAFAVQLRAFFTAEEQEDLATIQ